MKNTLLALTEMIAAAGFGLLFIVAVIAFHSLVN
jgi:hypothetical protein